MRLEKRQIKLNEIEFFSAFVMVSPAEINSKFSAHNSDILIFFFPYFLSVTFQLDHLLTCNAHMIWQNLILKKYVILYVYRACQM